MARGPRTNGGGTRTVVDMEFCLSPEFEELRRLAVELRALSRVGVPYTEEQIAAAPAEVQGKTKMDAVIAYLVDLYTPQRS